MHDHEFSLDAVAEILRRDLGLESAYVEQTGGGCATIFVGPTHLDHEGAARWAAIAGPGVYGWGHRDSVADLADFQIGADDDGDTDPVDAGGVGARTIRDVAVLIAAQARQPDPSVPLAFDQLERLGFDGTGRGNPGQSDVDTARRVP